MIVYNVKWLFKFQQSNFLELNLAKYIRANNEVFQALLLSVGIESPIEITERKRTIQYRKNIRINAV